MHIYTYKYIYAYINIYIHMYTHVYTHTQQPPVCHCYRRDKRTLFLLYTYT